MANKVYEYVTERILAELDKGIIPWRRPWKSVTASGLPISWVTKKAYRGVNRILLPAGEYLTYKQVQENGGKVKKGEAAIRTAEVDGERYCHSEYGSANCKWEPGIGCTPKCPECIP